MGLAREMLLVKVLDLVAIDLDRCWKLVWAKVRAEVLVLVRALVLVHRFQLATQMDLE
jgi:hypothetical protein